MAADVWADLLHEASFAGVAFDCLTTRDSIQRALAVHSYPGRDGADVQDMGAEPRRTTLSVLFYESDEYQENHLARFARFYEAINAGTAQELVHPITGSYGAYVESFDFETSGDERNVVACTVEFVEDTARPSGVQLDGRSLTVGAAAVTAQAAATAQALLDADLASDVPADVASAVSAWETDSTLTQREVSLQTGTLSQSIAGEIESLALASNPGAYLAWREMELLHDALVRASEAARQAQPQLFRFTVAAALPLLVIAAQLYGGARAREMADELVRLNDIGDPMLIARGTVLVASVPNAAPRAALRRPL